MTSLHGVKGSDRWNEITTDRPQSRLAWMLPSPARPGRDLIDRYDRHAKDYQEFWAPTLRIAGRRLIGAFESRSPRRIVDVATGVGALLPDLHTTFPASSVIGIDRSRGMLALAPREFPRALMDATQLALASASIDIVLQAFVLFHLSQPFEALREARRVLRSGGEIGCITWGGELESLATRVWAECLDEHGAQPVDAAIVTRHDAVDGPSKVEALLREAGFHRIRCWNEELEDRIDAERLIRLRTRMGSCKPRFDSLSEIARTACCAAARARMERLNADGFIARGEVVYSVASA